MIGTKISKPLITQEDLDNYSEIAAWCNENNATIIEQDDYYEVIDAPEPEPAVFNDEVTELQMALTEQYEENLALQEELTNTQMALTELYEAII